MMFLVSQGLSSASNHVCLHFDYEFRKTFEGFEMFRNGHLRSIFQVVDLLVSSAVQQYINQKFSSNKNSHLILNLNMNRADSSLQIKRLMPQKMLKQRLYSDHCKGKLGSFSNLKCILNLAFSQKKFAFKSPYLSHWLDVIFL